MVNFNKINYHLQNIFKYKLNLGSCIETYHTLNDGLWGLTDITKKK